MPGPAPGAAGGSLGHQQELLVAPGGRVWLGDTGLGVPITWTCCLSAQHRRVYCNHLGLFLLLSLIPDWGMGSLGVLGLVPITV